MEVLLDRYGTLQRQRAHAVIVAGGNLRAMLAPAWIAGFADTANSLAIIQNYSKPYPCSSVSIRGPFSFFLYDLADLRAKVVLPQTISGTYFPFQTIALQRIRPSFPKPRDTR
jgi:hypothetical protein